MPSAYSVFQGLFAIGVVVFVGTSAVLFLQSAEKHHHVPPPPQRPAASSAVPVVVAQPSVPWLSSLDPTPWFQSVVPSTTTRTAPVVVASVVETTKKTTTTPVEKKKKADVPASRLAQEKPPTTSALSNDADTCLDDKTTKNTPSAVGFSWSLFDVTMAMFAMASLIIILFRLTAEKKKNFGGAYSLIMAALQEPLSGKGHRSTSMAAAAKGDGGLGWNEQNYVPLKRDEIHRLLCILNAPHYNSSLNKNDLLCLLRQHYSSLLQACNTNELRNILNHQGVVLPSSMLTQQHQLAKLALETGFTGAAVY